MIQPIGLIGFPGPRERNGTKTPSGDIKWFEGLIHCEISQGLIPKWAGVEGEKNHQYRGSKPLSLLADEAFLKVSSSADRETKNAKNRKIVL